MDQGRDVTAFHEKLDGSIHGRTDSQDKLSQKKAGISAGLISGEIRCRRMSVSRHDRRATPVKVVVDARRDHIDI